MPRMGDLAATDVYDVPIDPLAEGGSNVLGGILNATGNVARGLYRDIPRAAEWFYGQASKPEAEAQADVGNVARWVRDVIPKAVEASEERRLGGEYNPGPILDAAMLGTSGGLLGGAGEGAGVVLTAGRRGRRLPPRPVAEDVPLPPRSHNMPPELVASEVPQMGSLAAPGPIVPPTWAEGLPRAKPAKRSTDIPSIRDLPVADALLLARIQPHLIKAGDQSEGYYVGGAREIGSKRALTNKRAEFDEYVKADPRGGNWYDRYRGGVGEVTGGDQAMQDWMAAQEGQWSAGVDPGSELHFALKENNASIAGMPVKAARPAQHAAHLRALESGDWRDYQLGDKTGEYARLINPVQGDPGATGVNDFRHARNWGYTEAGGEAQKNALTEAQHKFLDYETALAVDRANRSNLGGRSDWTGEQLQAAPWVRQKALDIQGRGGKNEDGSFKLSYEEAFGRANKTIADFFPRHTAFATFEAQPGSTTGHMMGSLAANPAERAAYAGDARSNWATALGGRDAIYSGLGVEGTGNYMRVRPSQDMTGYYKPPDAPIESNPGQVARPLVTFDTPPVVDKNFIGPQQFSPFKRITPHDEALLNAGEAVRGYLDAQNASAWHKNWTGGPLSESNSMFFPRQGPVSPDELARIQASAGRYGLGDVVDTGQGVTSTSFYPGVTAEQNKALTSAVRKGEFGEFGEPQRVRIDSGYIDYTEKWPEGVGSQAATKHMLEYLNRTPELRDAFNRNPFIAERAAAKLERDQSWAAKWGAPREDIQLARQIISQGPGWVDRLEAAVKAGAILPAVAAAIFAAGSAGDGGADEAL